MDCYPPGSSVYGIFLAKVLKSLVLIIIMKKKEKSWGWEVRTDHHTAPPSFQRTPRHSPVLATQLLLIIEQTSTPTGQTGHTPASPGNPTKKGK